MPRAAGAGCALSWGDDEPDATWQGAGFRRPTAGLEVCRHSTGSIFRPRFHALQHLAGPVSASDRDRLQPGGRLCAATAPAESFDPPERFWPVQHGRGNVWEWTSNAENFRIRSLKKAGAGPPAADGRIPPCQRWGSFLCHRSAIGCGLCVRALLPLFQGSLPEPAFRLTVLEPGSTAAHLIDGISGAVWDSVPHHDLFPIDDGGIDADGCVQFAINDILHGQFPVTFSPSPINLCVSASAGAAMASISSVSRPRSTVCDINPASLGQDPVALIRHGAPEYRRGVRQDQIQRRPVGSGQTRGIDAHQPVCGRQRVLGCQKIGLVHNLLLRAVFQLLADSDFRRWMQSGHSGQYPLAAGSAVRLPRQYHSRKSRMAMMTSRRAHQIIHLTFALWEIRIHRCRRENLQALRHSVPAHFV